VPAGNIPKKEEALAELAKRYFISHGPATLQDFTWWSGLAAADAGKGLAIVKSQLTNMLAEGQDYLIAQEEPIITGKVPIAHLLPAFDEFAVAYKDRAATVNPKYLKQARYVIFDPSIVVNNQVVGTWKRIVKKKAIDIILNPFGKLNKGQTKAVEVAKICYLKFMHI
jgi:hypothetical protein